jgi:tripartite-type tricarboxylate transporter receptor subunit TctC
MKMNSVRIAFTALACMCFMQAAQAAYPERPVKIVVAQAPGGAADIMGRLIAQKLSQRWGQPVIVENRVGAGGTIGTDAVAKAPNDGYTLVMNSDGPMAINASLYKSLPFDLPRDFTSITSIATFSFVLLINDKVPAKTFPEFVKLAQRNPKMTLGNAGNGSTNHLVGEVIKKSAKITMINVPYRGAAEAMTDLLGGRIDAMISSVPAAAVRIDNGSLRGLVVSSEKRATRLPGIPTMTESGFSQDVSPSWFGLFGPANLPQDIVRKIHADVSVILKDPEMTEKMLSQGLEPFENSHDKFDALWKSAIRNWAVVVKETGAQVN